MRKLTLVIAAIALGGFVLVGCGGDDESEATTEAEASATTTTEPNGGGGGADTVAVSAVPDGSLAYEQDSLSASAGSITFEFENPASTPHDFVVEDPSGETLGAAGVISESSEDVTIDLEPGQYTFYCSVGGHREAGMEGPLAVE